VELTSSTHPDEFGGRGWHTGGDIEPVEVPSNTGNHNPYQPGRQDSPGGFQAHDDNGPVILTTPAPEDMDFNDYILITPVADIPAIYVYLSEVKSDKITFDSKQLKRKFKHAIDFGVNGNPNKQGLAEFENAIKNHVNSSNTMDIKGTYRWDQDVSHYFDPKTNLDVIIDINGNFISAWRLSEKQTSDLLEKGNVF